MSLTHNDIPAADVTVGNLPTTKPTTLSGALGVLWAGFLGLQAAFQWWNWDSAQTAAVAAAGTGVISVIVLIASQFGVISNQRVDDFLADDELDGNPDTDA